LENKKWDKVKNLLSRGYAWNTMGDKEKQKGKSDGRYDNGDKIKDDGEKRG